MSHFSPPRRAAAVPTALLALFLCALGPVAALAGGTGWQEMERNHAGPARAAFVAALKQNRSDADATYGLGWLHLSDDSPAAAMKAWLPLYQMAPASWQAVACWPEMVELAERTGRWTLLDDAARGILASSKAPAELRASARLVLAAAADRAGRPADAQKLRAGLGFVRQWRVIGPFENISLSGFEKAYPPEREINLSRTYPGKDEQALAWHRLGVVTRDGGCAVGAALGGWGSCAYYAATAVFSPTETPVLLRFDPTGASKVFVNGRLVFADDTYRARQPMVADPFRIPAVLARGWNTVLVKSLDDESCRAEFAVRLTSPSGKDLSLQVDPSRATGAGATAGGATAGTPTEHVETAWVAALREKAPAQGTAAAMAIAEHLRRSRDYSAAAAILRDALKRTPECGWLHWLLSRTLERDEQADEARAERDLARKFDPRIVAAELAALEEDEAITPADRIRRLKSLLRISPQCDALHWALSGAYARAGLKADSLRAARIAAACAAGPSAIRRLFSMCRYGDRVAEAEKMLASALRTHPDSALLWDTQRSLLSEMGNTAAAIDACRRSLALDPKQTTDWFDLVDLYQEKRALSEALSVLRGLRAQYPQDPEVCERLADTLRETGKTRDAIPLYKTAIRLDPSRLALRDRLQVLAGERPVLDLAPATPAGPILAKLPKAADYPGASAVYLLDEARTVVYPDFARVTHTHNIIKILDAGAVRHYQRFNLAVPSASASVSVESARLIKADGKIQKVASYAGYSDDEDEDESDGQSVAFPSLAPGDTIDIAYRVEEYQPGGLARQFWFEWAFASPNEPFRMSRFVLITPPGMQFETRVHGGAPEVAAKDLKGWRVHEWRRDNSPALPSEMLSVPQQDCGPWIDISTVRSWSEIVQWYRALSGPRCVPDEAVRARAAELTRDAHTEEEKIRALVAFVARQIQYQTTPFRLSAYVPTLGKQVLRERYGDCKDKAALLTAMLAAVGIKANMVLLSSRDSGTTPNLPSPRFNHAVARVQTAGGPLWVDATADQMEYGYFPQGCQGVPALVIDDSTTDLTTSPVLPAERNQTTETHTCTLTPEGKLQGTLEVRAAGEFAWMVRSVMRLFPEANRDQALQRILNELVDGTRYDSGSIENLDDPNKPLVMRFRYHADGWATPAGNFLMARLPWIRHDKELVDILLSCPSRTHDVDVAESRHCSRSTIRLELPAGYVPQEIVPEAKGESEWGKYRFAYRRDGRVFQADGEVTMGAQRVPAASAPRFAEFLQAADREGQRALVLKRE